ncbi:unnamed protein product, partial [Didymodactylos carnosus]
EYIENVHAEEKKFPETALAYYKEAERIRLPDLYVHHYVQLAPTNIASVHYHMRYTELAQQPTLQAID